MTPEEIRDRVKTERRVLMPLECAERSGKIIERFLHAFLKEVPEIQGLSVALYRSVQGEVQMDPLWRALNPMGVRCFFPRVSDRDQGLMDLVEIPKDFSEPWGRGSFGIPEPPAKLPASDPAQIQWIVVPGIAFGEGGERLGMGAGFYDRLLVRVPHAKRVALAFDFQLFSSLPQQPWDQRVHQIYSETREIVVRPSPR